MRVGGFIPPVSGWTLLFGLQARRVRTSEAVWEATRGESDPGGEHRRDKRWSPPTPWGGQYFTLAPAR